MPIRSRKPLVTLVALGALVLAPAAYAGHGDEVEVRGTCSGRSTMELDVDREHGRLEVELEIDQNRSGVRWQIALRHNGVRFFRGTRTTRPPSGEIDLRRLTVDRPGRDTIRAWAKSPSGEVCTAVARI
ncbi:MAG: hypothetical protein U0R69_11135 [Gaiellales bacterium]